MTQPGSTDNVRPESASAMMAVLNGAWAARLVHAAAELGLADHLFDGAREVAFSPTRRNRMPPRSLATRSYGNWRGA
jgi:hypothetical protein